MPARSPALPDDPPSPRRRGYRAARETRVRRVALGLALALGSVVALLFLLRGSLSPANDAPAAGASANGAAPGPAAPRDDAGAAATTAAARVAAGPVVDATTTTTTMHRATLRVVDETGQPIAGARVQASAAGWRGEHLGFAPFDVEARFATAPAVSSGADGLAVVTASTSSPFVWARAGERFGQALIDEEFAAFGPVELVLRPDRDVRLVVRDGDGAGCARVPVALRFRTTDGADSDAARELMLGRSDGDGGLVLHHAQCLGAWDGRAGDLRARAVVLGAATPWIVVGADQTNVDLPCPAHGTLAIRWLPGAWQELRCTIATATAGGDAAPSSTEPTPANAPADAAAERFDDGDAVRDDEPTVARLHPVAIAQSWSIGLRRHAAVVRGPVAAGEVVEFVVPDEAAPDRLLVLDADGAPCADRLLEVALRHPRSGLFHFAWREQRTDADGRLRLVQLTESIDVRVVDPLAHAEGITRVEVFEDGRAFVGTVRLRPQHVLATGRVVGATSGRPRIARITLHESAADRGHGFAWTETAADGTFTIRGVRDEPFVVRCDATSVEWSPSTEPLLLTLPESPILAATVLVDEEVAVASFEVGVDGHYDRGDRVRRGRLDVTLRPGEPTAAAMLEVAPGENLPAIARVPRAEWRAVPGGHHVTVDLRGRLALATVAVRVEGRAVPARIALLERNGWFWQGQDAASFRLALPRDARWEAIVDAGERGCGAFVLVAGPNDVELPGPAVVSVALPAGLRCVVLHLREADPHRARAAAERPRSEPPQWPLDEDTDEVTTVAPTDEVERHATFHLVHRGTYAVVPTLSVGDTTRRLLAHAVRLEVDELARAMHVDVPVPPDVVRSLREELERGR